MARTSPCTALAGPRTHTRHTDMSASRPAGDPRGHGGALGAAVPHRGQGAVRGGDVRARAPGRGEAQAAAGRPVRPHQQADAQREPGAAQTRFPVCFLQASTRRLTALSLQEHGKVCMTASRPTARLPPSLNVALAALLTSVQRNVQMGILWICATLGLFRSIMGVVCTYPVTKHLYRSAPQCHMALFLSTAWPCSITILRRTFCRPSVSSHGSRGRQLWPS